MAAFGLYTHIRANRIRSAALLAGLFGLVFLLTFAGALLAEAAMGDAPLAELLTEAAAATRAAAPWVAAGTALWIVIAYRFHQAMIDLVTGGRAITREESPRLYNLLENLCISRGLAMPALKRIDTSVPNAFATGLTRKQYAITVTTGLEKLLNDAEMEAVFGHELTHIRNGDVRLLVIAVVIAGVISFFGELIFRGLTRGVGIGPGRSRRNGRSGGGGGGVAILIALALIAVAWLLSIVIRFSLSRAREFLADAGSVELTKNPDAMISALRKIEGRGELHNVPSAVMEMCLDNPREGFSDLFATHPSVERRIDALIRTAGGHDPGLYRLAEDDSPSGEEPPGPWGNHEEGAVEPDGPWGHRPLP